MNDHLQVTSPGLRRVGAGLAGFAAVLSWAITAIPLLTLFRDESIQQDRVLLAVVVPVFGALGMYCTCLTWRLFTGRKAANGITIMPPWTIQAFGVFLAFGGVAVAFTEKSFWLAIEIFSIAGTMLLVGRNIAARKRRQQAGSAR